MALPMKRGRQYRLNFGGWFPNGTRYVASQLPKYVTVDSEQQRACKLIESTVASWPAEAKREMFDSIIPVKVTR